MCFQWRVKAGGGMSDLSVYELGDNVWDEFGASDDHIVPHPAGGYCDQFGVQSGSLKKSRYDISSSDDASGSTTQRNKETGSSTFTKKDIMLEKSPWSHTPDGVFTGSCENGSVNEITSISSEEGRIPDECLKNDNIDALGAEFCVEDSILGKKYTAVDNNANCYPLSHITQTDNDLTFFNDDREDKDGSDLLYYGWPDDIGNFEDVDKIFRSCDSTFGLDSLGKEDDFCWFTSSHSAEGCDDVSKLGSKFSTSEACELTDASGLNSLGPSVNDSNKLNSFTCDATSDRTGSVLDQAAVSQITSLNPPETKSVIKDDLLLNKQVSWDKKQARHQNQSEGKRKNRPIKNGPQHRRQSMGFNSLNYMQAHVPYGHMDFSQYSDQTSLCPSQPGPSALYDPVSVRRQAGQSEYKIKGNGEIEVGMGAPAEPDASNVQESSCMSSVLDEISFEASSFRQLQQVMEQLDIRTKLCIRDSLYRLARSAEHRHNCGNLKGGKSDDTDRSYVLMAEETNRTPGFVDMETDTNPIDRSVAHLLFHRPPGPSVMPAANDPAANDTLSDQSHVMIHGLIASPPVMAKEQIHPKESTAGADGNVSVGDDKQ